MWGPDVRSFIYSTFYKRQSSLSGWLDLSPGLSLDLSSNSVQVTSALAGQPPPAVGILLHELQTLQGLESLPGQTTGSPAPVGGRAAVALADAVDLTDGGDTDWRPGKGG